jgi:predicted DNA-binding transcriptional regulator YafY
MARVDRVMDLLELLRARDVTHLAELAAALGVSTRTVLRDLGTLRQRGWPIRAEQGPGGGIRLERDRGVASVHLTVDELASLWLATKVTESVSAVPWSHAARVALDKALGSLPAERVRTMRRLVRRIVIGRPASARIVGELGRPSPEALSAFEQAFSASLCLRFDYSDRHGRRTSRIVEPHGLLAEVPAWYLLTRDTATGLARLFRLDRMTRVEVVADRPFRPDFDGLHEQVREQWRREAVSPSSTVAMNKPSKRTP